MSISAPERVWWKPVDKEEKIWFAVALVWVLGTFFWMPIWHNIGKQNPSSESYKVTREQFEQKATNFIQQYQVKDESGNPVTVNNVPLVRPPEGDVYMVGKAWAWEPVLELEKGKTYRIHLSSYDFQHGFSIYPLNINYMALPGYDYVITVKPTTSGEFPIICNEFCGIGHHAMLGRLIVK
jgi:cytochrome c oxidase subunit 2